MKHTLFILGIMAILAASGCESSEKKESKATEREMQTTLIMSDNTNSTDESILEDGIYNNPSKIPNRGVYVDFGKRVKDIEYSSVVYHTNHTDMVALHYNVRDMFSGNLDDVFDFLNNGSVFIDLMSYAYPEANFLDSKNYKIAASSKEKVTVAGIDAVRIVGSVDDANGRNCYAYGYTFILDDTPVFLVGFVFSEEQDPETIESITEEVDAMMETVRTELRRE